MITPMGKDERGSVTVIFAVSFLILAAFAAIAVDFGSAYVTRRKAQADADLAALSAASRLDSAWHSAERSLRENASPGEIVDLVLGTYTPEPALRSAARFVPNAAPPNAVRLQLRRDAPALLGERLYGQGKLAIETSATAARSAHAAFAVGSGLLSFQGGVANGVLSQLAGADIQLSVADYRALASAHVDLFDFSQALAKRLDIQAGSFQSVLASRTTLGQVSDALRTVLRQKGERLADQALASVGSAPVKYLSPFTSMINPGPYGASDAMTITGFTANADALSVLRAALTASQSGRQLEGDLSVGLPGIAAVKFRLVIGDPEKSSQWAAVGADGTTVRTAQIRLLIIFRLLGVSALVPYIELPIYIQLASGVAAMSALRCPSGKSDLTVSIDAQPGLSDIWIGQNSDRPLGSWSSSAGLSPAILLSTPALTITAQSHVSLQSGRLQRLEFNQSEIADGVRKSASSSDPAQGLMASLLAKTNVQVRLLGVGVTPDLSQGAVTQLLTANAAAMDAVLQSALSILGIRVGYLDVAVLGARCDGAVLVQ